MTRLLSGPAVEERPPVAHGELTEQERAGLAAAFEYARRHDLSSPPDEAYRRELSAARWGVLTRLIGGLARDRPDALPDSLVVDAADPDLSEIDDEPLASLDGDALAARLPDADGADRVLLLRLPASEAVVAAPVADRRAFERLSFVSPAVTCRVNSTEPVGSPESLVPFLDREHAFDAPEAPDRFRTELGESVANLGLARLGERVQWRSLPEVPTPVAEGEAPGADTTAAMDRLVTEGHPFHPGAKLRHGMTPTEALAFTPEHTDSIGLRFVAVHADTAMTASVDETRLTERLLACYPDLEAAVAAAIPSGRAVEEYAVLPVHPWQLRRVVSRRYGDQRRRGTVVPMSGVSRPASPLLSIRTVVPEPGATATDHPPHLKLALGVQTTNAVRTLSPHAVANGPQLTGLLRRAVASLSVDSFGVLGELAATCYHPPDGPHPDGDGYDDARHLSALLRQHPHSHPVVGAEDAVVTAASLLATAPSGDPELLSATIDAFARAREITDRTAAVEGFLDAYLDAVVPGALGLLVTHGIALEAHLQNTYIVFDGASPTGALVSDFGGVRVHEPRLTDAGCSLSPYPDSTVITTELAVTREKLWYSLFQNQIGELVGRLADSEPVTDAACWERVRGCCERTFEQLATAGVSSARVGADRESLFAETLVHKALTAMRIRGSVREYCRTTVPNPLAKPGEDGR